MALNYDIMPDNRMQPAALGQEVLIFEASLTGIGDG
jgi:hypothetical protein